MASGADHSLALRGASITALRARAALLALLDGEKRIHAEQPPDPVWPWVRWGRPIVVPDESSGHIGAEVRITFHAFADDSTVCHAICREIVYALDGQGLTLEPEDGDRPGADPHVVSLDWAGTEVGPDTARKGGYHGVIQFDALTAETR